MEIKASSRVNESDARTLNAFISSINGAKGILVSLDLNAKQYGEVRAVNWRQGLREIFPEIGEAAGKR